MTGDTHESQSLSLKSFTLGCKVDCDLKTGLLCLSVQPHPSSLSFCAFWTLPTSIPKEPQEWPVVLHRHGCSAPHPSSVLLAESTWRFRTQPGCPWGKFLGDLPPPRWICLSYPSFHETHPSLAAAVPTASVVALHGPSPLSLLWGRCRSSRAWMPLVWVLLLEEQLLTEQHVYTHTHTYFLFMVVPITPLLRSFSAECLETVGKLHCAASLHLPDSSSVWCVLSCSASVTWLTEFLGKDEHPKLV